MTRFSFPAVFAVLAVLGAASPTRSIAADAQSFIIAARDGYGISECLDKAGDCGKVVADAWCESHGLSKALSYGHVEDVTSAIQTAAAATPGASSPAANPKAEPGSYVINCQQ